MNVIRATYKSFIIIVGFIIFHLTILSALTFVEINGYSLLQYMTCSMVRTGEWGQSLIRFRELENIDNVDILFIGSSHAYRGFDPRLFKSKGYSSFNIGSSAQTPLNTYYLLNYYLPKIKPKVIIYEIYPVILSRDGYECTLDLLMNTHISLELLEMSIATGNPNAFTNCIGRFIHNIVYPLKTMKQKQIINERYIPGGYVETDVVRNDRLSINPIHVNMLDSQLKYISKIMELANDLNIELIGVIQPLPVDYLLSISNYKIMTSKLMNIANKNKVSIYDFNDIIVLDSVNDFKDKDHLNKSGVVKFNNMLINKLFAEKGLKLDTKKP